MRPAQIQAHVAREVKGVWLAGQEADLPLGPTTWKPG